VRIAFLYTGDWSHEFDAYGRGDVPAHRLFGAGQMWLTGTQAVHCHWGRWPRQLRHPHVWKVWQTLWLLLTQRSVDAVVATTESPALAPLLCRRLGLLWRPVITISVAALRPSYTTGWRGVVVRRLLARSDLVLVYASAQVEPMTRRLGVSADRVRFVPLGVDTDFFAPLPRSGDGPAVLSVGTNEGKDFATLLDALPAERECLIVTDARNAEIVRSSPSRGRVDLAADVPITRLRDLYAAAGRCVIPLREADFSSGQTVMLEMLAMGVPLTVSDVSAVRDYVGAVATSVPAGDSAALREALEPSIGIDRDAVDHVRASFTSVRFSADLTRLANEVCSRRR
jgi:glycosyltransferase involved in cell wall biosynthesis